MTVDVGISDELKQVPIDLKRDFHHHAETAWTVPNGLQSGSTAGADGI